MRHALFPLLLALLLSSCGADGDVVRPGAAAPSPTAVPLPIEGDEASDGAASTCVGRGLDAFERRPAMRHVRKLAGDIGVRVRATRGERRGARYIAGRFRALGYDVRVNTFSVDGRTSRNVVATWPGAIRYPFVLGGHMDTVPGAPGANDNASGVAVLLEAARLAAGKEQACLVKFVAFGAEERGADGTHHVGSDMYVNRLRDKARRKTPGMLSVDMIADGRPLIAGYFGEGPEIVWRRTARIIRNAGIAIERRRMCDCSDNGPFGKAGIPAALLWSGTEPDYHSPSDIPANLKKADLVRTGRAVRAFLKALDRDLIRAFRDH